MLSNLSSKFSSKFSSIRKGKKRDPIQKQCNKDNMVLTISTKDNISDNEEYNMKDYIPKYKRLLRFYEKKFNSTDKIATYIGDLSTLFIYLHN